MRGLLGLASVLVVLLVVAFNAKHALNSQVAAGQPGAASQAAAPRQQVEAFQQQLDKAMAAAASQASASE